MVKRLYTSSYISDHGGGKIIVTCPKCGLWKQYDADQILRRIEDLPMPALLTKLAKAEGCEKTDNGFYDRCRLHYDIELMMALRQAAKPRGNIE